MRTSTTILALLVLGGSLAAGAPILVPGDKVVSRVADPADVDEFLLPGTAGGSCSVSVEAGDGGLSPALRLFAPSGEEVNLSPWVSTGSGIATLTNLIFGETGFFRLEVSGGGTTSGTFSLAFKSKNAKKLKARSETLAPGASRSYTFAGAAGGTVKVAVKFRTPDTSPVLVALLDAKGTSHAADVVGSVKGLKGSFAATGVFGEWRLTLRNNGAADAVYDISIASKLPKLSKSSRTFPNVTVTGVGDGEGTHAPVTFDVWDPDRRTVTVLFSWSLDDGAHWTDCLPVPSGQNPMVVGGGATGYGFDWDTLAQVGQDFGLSCAYLADVRIRAEVVAPDGDGDEFHPLVSPFELWAYPEPAAEDVRADVYPDLGEDGALDSLIVIDTRTETDYETRHVPGAVAYGPPHSFALGDFDGDLVPDLVTSEPGGISVMLHLGHGDGTFASPVAAGPGQRPSKLAVGDLDGDGALDVVHSNRGSTELSVLLGNGDGTFAGPARFDAGRSARALLIDHFDGDLVRDLLVLSDDVVFFSGQGDGTFGSPVSSPCGEDPGAFASGLLSGDLLLDLAVTNRRSYGPDTPPDVSVLIGNGDGTFGAPEPHEVGEDPTCVVIADFDLDGAPDLAVANRGSRTVSVLLNQGGAGFDPALNHDGGNQPTVLAAADVTGDARPDLLVANLRHVAPGLTTPAAVAVLEASTGGGFGPPVLFPTGDAPALLLTGDLDGDLDPDVVVGNSGPGNRSVLLGTGDGDLIGLPFVLDRRVVFYCYGLG